MKIHLVTYGTARFWHRQWVLGTSAKLHGVTDTVTHWTPYRLRRTDFSTLTPDIALDERGSGFWAWKPYIILKKLSEVPDGELVFYCDVGRRFPYKILDRPLTPLLDWMNQTGQDVMPGLSIIWRGPLSTWTKRDAFVITGMDHSSAWSAPTVQASFSMWRSGPGSRNFVSKWLDWCSDRRLVSDDPSICGQPEFPDFHEHRHDQSLLSLLCLQLGVVGFDAGSASPPVDTRDPSAVIGHYFQTPPLPSPASWKCLKPFLRAAAGIERALRGTIHFNRDQPSHPLATD